MFLDPAAWLADIQATYRVNPFIFGALYLLGVGPFWFSLYKIIAGLKRRDFRQIRIFSLILGIAIILPFGYVVAFGHNLPVWFWAAAGLVILFSFYSVYRKLKRVNRFPKMISGHRF